ncbi:MAG: putative dimethyl sulfoxide reductase chain YnfE precursor [Acidobacteria bacterium ADurb.Bin340]|nr:MAG: putative dimethyl sulfoxide reductase chain YnfE precursor [Acidobacteria bacterium ADurb.Bin340]
MPVVTTACPRNCYSTCAMKVTVEGGRITALDAHPGNRATPEGPCLKGLSYVERIYHPDRILHPLRRCASGGFEQVSWDEALDLMVERLGPLRSEPQSLLHYNGSGTKGLLNGCSMAFWRLFGGCTTTYGDLCWPAGLEATRLTLGDNLHNAPWDLANARLLVFWGKNAAETNLHQMRFVDQAVEAGASCVVIDPRRTPTAEKADLFLQPRPGTDGALALALGHLLVREGGVDEAFVNEHVKGFEAYAERVAAWTPTRAAEVCGVPEAQIRELARRMASIRPMTIVPGFGMQRYTNAGQTFRALLALAVITGNLGLSGGGWQYANLATQVFSPVRDPLDFFPPEKPDGVVRVSVSTARLGQDMLAQQDPPLRAAWVERGNPLSQNPDTNRVREAFRRLAFRVVVEERLTDTAKEADLVLPAKTFFEQTDVIGAYWHGYLQLRPKVIEPPGEVKPETEILWALGQRLGIDETTLRTVLPEPGEAGVEAWLNRRLAPLGLVLDDLREGPVPAPGMPEVAWADRRFSTPSGKVEIWSDEAAARWGVDPVADFREPEEWASEPDQLHLLTPNTKNSIHSQFHMLPSLRGLGAEHAIFLHPEDAEARGLRHGDRVRIFNSRGELVLPLRLDFGLRRGVVVAYNGFGEEDGGSVNRLSLGRETDLGHGAAFHDCWVKVEGVRP